MERDFSFIFPGELSFQQIETAVRTLNISELKELRPADLLLDKAAERAGIPAGKYSLLLRVNFQSSDRTLRDEEVAAWSGHIIAALEKLGGSLRSS